MNDPGKAVFLSYASQDAEAAKCICDALRTAGVEVWFDQSELVGGDQWDQKIRKQIKECALLIPIISTATQARTEGYFRLEWRLADQRTHLMAKGRAFLLPVVIDDTRDADAHVPDSFTEVQWTRLPGGETPPAFAARVRKLLGNEVGPVSDRPFGSSAPSEAGHRPALPGKSRPRWLMPVIGGGVVAAIALTLTRPWQDRNPPASGLPPAVSPSNPSPVSTAAPAAALTEAQKLVAKARKIYDDGDELNRDNLFLADEMVQRALALDPSEPSAWELATWFSYVMVWHAIDVTQVRRETLLRQANRAIALAPDSVAAQLVYANAQLAGRFGGANASPGNFATIEASLKQLAGREPQNWKIQRALGTVYRLTQRMDEAVRTFNRAIELSGGDPMATADLVNVLIRRNHFAEAEALLARELAHHRSSRLLTFNLIVKYRWRGDAESAVKDIADWPEWLLQQDRGFAVAWQAALWARQPDLALRLVLQFPRQEVRDIIFSGPKAVLSARAQELAGNTVAAQADWRAVLQQCDQDLAANATDLTALYWKAWALARLGDQTGAPAVSTLLRQRLQSVPSNYIHSYTAAALWATVGWTDVAVTTLQAELQTPTDYISLSRAGLELEPAFDPIRQDPRFQELVRLAPAPEGPRTEDRGQSTAQTIDSKSVAVLAFANLSDDKANEYFSDGISEELLNVLAKVPQLKVAARTSSFYFKGRNEPIPEIAQKLGVAYVVEGSVRKAGNRVRVTAQLIKASDGYHVWSETYDRDLTDIFAVQDEIAKNILGVVKGSLLGEAELPHAKLTNIEAYTLYLQAQAQFAQRGDAGLREAIRLYEASLAIDPNYVPALVGLAQARVVLPNYAYLSGAKARETTDRAIKAARRALELDPQNASAFAVIGWAGFQFDWKWAESGVALRRARDLAPNDAWTWNCLGDYYRFVGDLAQAQVAKQREYDLDPLSQNSHWDQSYNQLVAGHYDEAIHWAERCVQLAPHNVDSYMPAILAAGRMGRFDLMHRMMTAARQNVHEGEGMLTLLEAYGAILEKKHDEARRLLGSVSTLAENETASPAYLGYCYLLLGDTEQAVGWLQKGYDRHDPAIVWNEIVDFDVIAANPRTRPILDQPGLKELYELRQRNARAGLNKL